MHPKRCMHDTMARQPLIVVQLSKVTGQWAQRQSEPSTQGGSLRMATLFMQFLTSNGLIPVSLCGAHPSGPRYPHAPGIEERQQPCWPNGPVGQNIGEQVSLTFRM